MTTTITEREILSAIRATFETGESPLDAETVVAYCDKKLAALDARAEKARERAAAKRAENDVLLEQVFDVLTADPAIIADITAAVATVNPDATVARVTNRLSALTKAGRAVKSQVTVSGGEGEKSRKLSAYAAC